MNAARRCILLLADGARPDVLRELCDRGDLPHLARTFVEGGSTRVATTVFPSTTGPAHLPFLTGLYPGDCDVPGIRWFDPVAFEASPFSLRRFRSYVGPGVYLFDRDLRADVHTLFGYVRDHANVFGNCTRELRPSRHLTRFTKLRLNLLSFFSTSYGLTDETCAALVEEAAHRRFVFAVLPGIDSESHKEGVRAPRTLQAYRRLDAAVGRVTARLRERGLQDDTLLVVVSDHGLTDTERHFDLEAWLQGRRGPVLAYPKLRGLFGSARAACMVSGNAMAHVHLRGEKAWGDEAASRETALALREEAAIDVVAWREASGVAIASRRGEARLRRTEDGALEYGVVGADPFGYGALPSRMDDGAALAATCESEHPDALVQLAQIFTTRRTGDLVVTSAPGWDLRARFERPPHRGSHGALHRAHMAVPLWTSRPIDGERPLRSVDVFAAILGWFGEAQPEGLPARPFTFT